MQLSAFDDLNRPLFLKLLVDLLDLSNVDVKPLFLRQLGTSWKPLEMCYLQSTYHNNSDMHQPWFVIQKSAETHMHFLVHLVLIFFGLFCTYIMYFYWQKNHRFHNNIEKRGSIFKKTLFSIPVKERSWPISKENEFKKTLKNSKSETQE